MTLIEIIEDYNKSYNEEYKVKRPQLVTTKMDQSDDGCGDAIMRRVRMTDKETMMRDGYDDLKRKVLTYYVSVGIIIM